MPDRRAARRRRLPEPRGVPGVSPRVSGWFGDVLLGIVVGSVVFGGLGESVLITAQVNGSRLLAVVLIICGSILGIGFMRVVRRRASEEERLEAAALAAADDERSRRAAPTGAGRRR